MGQPAFSKIYVSFETAKKAKEADKLLKNFNEICRTRFGGDADFTELTTKGKELYCEVHSQRVQNCEWQVERVIELLGEVGGVTELSTDLFVMGDGHYFSPDATDETFEEFAANFKTTK